MYLILNGLVGFLTKKVKRGVRPVAQVGLPESETQLGELSDFHGVKSSIRDGTAGLA